MQYSKKIFISDSGREIRERTQTYPIGFFLSDNKGKGFFDGCVVKKSRGVAPSFVVVDVII